MRLSTSSRQSDTTMDTADRAPVSARTDAPTQAGAVRADERRAEYVRAEDRTAPMAKVDDRTERFDRVMPDRDSDSAGRHSASRDTDRTGRHSASIVADRDADGRTDRDADGRTDRDADGRTDRDADGRTDRYTDRDAGRHIGRDADRTPASAGPKPRASLLATLGLVTGVAAALLVLSGPLLGYGIGLAGLSLILSVLGLRATRKSHVAGKTDALIGLGLALASIVVGVLVLTGTLSWLGTDLQSANSAREWLDAQFTKRF